MTDQLYYQMNDDGTGFAFISGEPEFFRCFGELFELARELFPQGCEFVEVTPDNWQALYDAGAFDNEAYDY